MNNFNRVGVVVLRLCSDVADFAKIRALMPDAIAISDGGANGGGFATVGAGAFPNGPAETLATAR